MILPIVQNPTQKLPLRRGQTTGICPQHLLQMMKLQVINQIQHVLRLVRFSADHRSRSYVQSRLSRFLLLRRLLQSLRCGLLRQRRLAQNHPRQRCPCKDIFWENRSCKNAACARILLPSSSLNSFIALRRPIAPQRHTEKLPDDRSGAHLSTANSRETHPLQFPLH